MCHDGTTRYDGVFPNFHAWHYYSISPDMNIVLYINLPKSVCIFILIPEACAWIAKDPIPSIMCYKGNTRINTHMVSK